MALCFKKVPKWHLERLIFSLQHGIMEMRWNVKLKEIRQLHHLTQAKCAEYLGIPLRTYKRYEGDEEKIPPIKRAFILSKLQEIGKIDEEHGVLTTEAIKRICADVFQNYVVDYCYLFGSYAKGKATETSDVDLFLSTEAEGLRFFGLVEALRTALNKRVDVLDQRQIDGNENLLQEILKDGVKIYG